MPPPKIIMIKKAEPCVVYLPKPVMDSVKMQGHMMEQHNPPLKKAVHRHGTRGEHAHRHRHDSQHTEGKQRFGGFTVAVKEGGDLYAHAGHVPHQRCNRLFVPRRLRPV